MVKIAVFLSLFYLPFQLVAAEPGKNPEKIIKVRADIWCPFNCQPGAPKEGIMLDIMRMALENKGYKVDYQLMNWARAIEETRAGKYDAIVGASKSDAPDFTFTSQAIAGTNYQFYTLKGSNWRYKDESSFKNVKVGIINGYSYDDKFMEISKKHSASVIIVSGEEGLDQLVKMLDQKRIDILIESPGVFKSYLEEQKKDFANYREAGETEKKMQHLYVAFSPKLKEALEIEKLISSQVVSLRKTGKLKTLLKKYNLKDI